LNQMQLSTTDPRGSQVGIARWAGTVCSWTKGTAPSGTRTPTPTGANGNSTMDFDSSGPSSNTGEYTTPCYPDGSVLSYLSQDKNVLTKIINNTGTGVCPTKPAAPSTPTHYSPGTMAQYACPIDNYDFPFNGIMSN